MECIVIPADPARPVDFDVHMPTGSKLDWLQGLVGGMIESIPAKPAHAAGSSHDAERVTLYINEEGKFLPDCKPNMRATDFLVPGVGLFFGDHIAGDMVITGFDPETGETGGEIPESIVRRARLIADEAGLRPNDAQEAAIAQLNDSYGVANWTQNAEGVVTALLDDGEYFQIDHAGERLPAEATS